MSKLDKIQEELSALAAGMQALGVSQTCHGDAINLTDWHIINNGYLVKAMGNYAQRLANDIDLAALDEKRSREGGGGGGATGQYLHPEKSE